MFLKKNKTAKFIAQKLNSSEEVIQKYIDNMNASLKYTSNKTKSEYIGLHDEVEGLITELHKYQELGLEKEQTMLISEIEIKQDKIMQLKKKMEQKWIIFSPGKIGISYAGNTIEKIYDNTQASRKGVRAGWKILSI